MEHLFKNSFFLILLGALVEVEQPKERLGRLEAILGGFISSVVISFFLFFFIHGWAVLFFFVFFAAYLAYSLYNPKPKPGVSVVMVATPSRKVYDQGNPKGSCEEKKYRLRACSARLKSLFPQQDQAHTLLDKQDVLSKSIF